MEGHPKESPFHGWDIIEEDPVQYKDQMARGLQFAFGLVRKKDPIVGQASPLDKNVAVYQKPSNGDYVVVSRAGNNPNDIRIFEITNDWYGDPDPDMGGMVKRVIEMADGSGMLRKKDTYQNYLEVAEGGNLFQKFAAWWSGEKGETQLGTTEEKTDSHIKTHVEASKKPGLLDTIGNIGKRVLSTAFAADGKQVGMNPVTTITGAANETKKKKEKITKADEKASKEAIATTRAEKRDQMAQERLDMAKGLHPYREQELKHKVDLHPYKKQYAQATATTASARAHIAGKQAGINVNPLTGAPDDSFGRYTEKDQDPINKKTKPKVKTTTGVKKKAPTMKQKPVGQKPVGQKPVGQQPVGQQPVGKKPVGKQPVQKTTTQTKTKKVK